MVAFLFVLLLVLIESGLSQECTSKYTNQSIPKPFELAETFKSAWDNCPSWIAKNDSHSHSISKADGVRIDLSTNHPNAGY